MRILVNGLSARVGGGRTVLQSHIDALLASPQPHELIVVTTNNSQLGELDAVVRVLNWPRMPTPLRIMLEQLAIPVIALRYRVHAIYCMGNVGLVVPVRPVVQLLQSPHHFAPLSPPERRNLYSRARRLRYRVEAGLARITARQATMVCAVSGSLAAVVRSEWPEVAARVRVVSNSLPADPPAADPGVRPPPYCLFVANDYPHKHWDDVIEAFRGYHELPALVIVGQPGPHRSTEVVEIERLVAALSAHRVVLLGSIVDRGLLVWLYETAAVVLVHSTSETFGLTLLEALAHNGRVAAADLPAHREAAGGRVATFYNPADVGSMVHALLRAIAIVAPVGRQDVTSENGALATSLERVFNAATSLTGVMLE